MSQFEMNFLPGLGLKMVRQYLRREVRGGNVHNLYD